MVKNIVILSGNSHPTLVDRICNILGVPPCDRILSKFSVGESRCEIKDSVRGKDVYIVQSGGGSVNDHFVELCIMISACKTGSAKRVTAVLPIFPYSRQPDLPYNKVGAPLSKPAVEVPKEYTFESVPPTPGPGVPKTSAFANGIDITRMLSRTALTNGRASPIPNDLGSSASGTAGLNAANGRPGPQHQSQISTFEAKRGYKKWIAQAGTLVANLITCAGADHVVTLELHDPQYQGFFDIPVDNLYARPLLKGYIQQRIPNYKEAVIVSPDAGGTKRATSIADNLGMDFALIHKVRSQVLKRKHGYLLEMQERRPTKITERQNATMMLVGDVRDRVCILIDDLVDTANTITRAAKLLHREGATAVYALITHGIMSGDAIARINASALDKVIVTNSVPQDEHRALCPKLEVLDVAPIFAEAIRRVHHGESLSVLFQHD
ncbi:phosphoribosyltransferase-like protein [Phialemonium atrogriseum]|uniref:ribose-phosphate diphosphokinase n=1 Tax=Phialemonium atrogriseum TaxID=1093897 RepID=A0AAJ0FHD6_9PEZI|nr:phosphoribosyltransferase-like protein [Phialemonium atrogriseum]KAK1768476.1 phosphoribosyltransferase-like protein [Phialemonium atrogriseum]